MTNQDKLSKGITGIAGEYFVAAELSRRGFMASVTLRNNDSIDIHASKNSGSEIFAIQVKTNQYGGRSWPLNKKCELLKNPNLFYVFVSLKGLTERPEYFIVPSDHRNTTHLKQLLPPHFSLDINHLGTPSFSDHGREIFDSNPEIMH